MDALADLPIDSPCRLGDYSGMTVRKSPDESAPGDDTALLIAALAHSWAWYDIRISRVLQLNNFFLLAIAALLNAYVYAISGKHYSIAVVIGLSGAIYTALTFAIAYQQLRLAIFGELAVAEIEDRIADRLKLDVIRMVRNKAESVPRRPLPSLISVTLTGLLCAGSAVYALIQGLRT